MRVVDNDEQLALFETGEWFDNPKCLLAIPAPDNNVVSIESQIQETQKQMDELLKESNHEQKKRGRPGKK